MEAEGLVTVAACRSPLATVLSAGEAAQVHEVRAVLAGRGFTERALDEEEERGSRTPSMGG